MIGMVGVLADVSKRIGAYFLAPDDAIVVLGGAKGELGGSQYLSLMTGDTFGAPPRVDLAAERALVDLLVEAAARGLLASAHDVSDGGLAVALVESATQAQAPFGLDVDLTGYAGEVAPAAALFGEEQARAVVSTTTKKVGSLLALAEQHGVPAIAVGTVGQPDGAVRIRVDAAAIERPVRRLLDVYENAIPRRMGGEVAELVAAAGA